MDIEIFTLFPEMFRSYFGASILQRAQAAGRLTIQLHNIRDYGVGRHRITDEPPFGGGGGMVLRPDPIFAAVEAALAGRPKPPIILLSPQGRVFSQKIAQELAVYPRLFFISGRYEGIDERVRQHLATDEISIGDYVLTGGELPTMVIVDAIARLLPGVLGATGAAQTDSHATGLLEGPHYTRPESFRGWPVPPVLRSGHAAKIAQWRRQQALRRTWLLRPELLLTAPLSEEDKQHLEIVNDEL